MLESWTTEEPGLRCPSPGRKGRQAQPPASKPPAFRGFTSGLGPSSWFVCHPVPASPFPGARVLKISSCAGARRTGGAGLRGRGEEPVLQWETRVLGARMPLVGPRLGGPAQPGAERGVPPALLGPAPAPARLLFKRLPPSLSSRSRRRSRRSPPSLSPRLRSVLAATPQPQRGCHGRYVSPRPAVSDLTPRPGPTLTFRRARPSGLPYALSCSPPSAWFCIRERRRAGGECLDLILSARASRRRSGRPPAASGCLCFRPLLPLPALLVPDHTICICHSQNFLSPSSLSLAGPILHIPSFAWYRCRIGSTGCSEEK